MRKPSLAGELKLEELYVWKSAIFGVSGRIAAFISKSSSFPLSPLNLFATKLLLAPISKLPSHKSEFPFLYLIPSPIKRFGAV